MHVRLRFAVVREVSLENLPISGGRDPEASQTMGR
jgi:hypothetical protein